MTGVICCSRDHLAASHKLELKFQLGRHSLLSISSPINRCLELLADSELKFILPDWHFVSNDRSE